VVSQVTLAALNLSGIPKLVVVAVSVVSVVGAGNNIGGSELSFRAAGRQLASAGLALEAGAGAIATVLVVTSKLLHVFAGAMARAAFRTSGAAASLSFVAIEADALTSLAVAAAFVATLGVVVSLVGTIGSISPCKGEGAGP